MKAIITVTGKDSVGIIAQVSAICAEKKANILDITQSVISSYFAMIMLVDISELTGEFTAFADAMTALGQKNNLVISTMHEDIFNTMHHV